MGTAFSVILDRTIKFRSRFEPARWLSMAYRELHAIFESFDGVMFMSAIIGVIDEDDDMLYTLNAEHPQAVLYRNNKASFISQSILKKLGTPYLGENTENVYIRRQKLETGDIVLIGSDGKDDYITHESGIMNSDETRFLEIVEKSNANLDLIFQETAKLGKITDDFSLLKIIYLANDRDIWQSP